MRTSEYFPMVVENDDDASLSYEEIVLKALHAIDPGYVGMHEYFVIPMHLAKVVAFHPPKPKYEVSIRDF